jgi:hypothetical protein
MGCAHVYRFLGLLHMEIWGQRLEQEHNAAVIVTTPTVPYTLQHADGRREEIQNPCQVRLGAPCCVAWCVAALPAACPLQACPQIMPCKLEHQHSAHVPVSMDMGELCFGQ